MIYMNCIVIVEISVQRLSANDLLYNLTMIDISTIHDKIPYQESRTIVKVNTLQDFSNTSAIFRIECKIKVL